MLFRPDFHSLARFQLGESDGGFACDPLIVLITGKRLPERVADHLAGVVVKSGRDLGLYRGLQFGSERNVHGLRLQRLGRIVKEAWTIPEMGYPSLRFPGSSSPDRIGRSPMDCVQPAAAFLRQPAGAGEHTSSRVSFLAMVSALTPVIPKSFDAGITPSLKCSFFTGWPARWLGTLACAVGAAYWVARSESVAAARPGVETKSPAGKQARAFPTTDPGPPPTARRGSHPTRESEGPGAWMAIPETWMKHCRLTAGSEQLHRLLRLDLTQGEALARAAGQAMRAAKLQQISGIDDFVMKENQTLQLPALKDGAIHMRIEEVVVTLPNELSEAERDLVRFVMERQLREEYGEDLEVTLEFTGNLMMWDVRHLSSDLLGFHFVERPVGGKVGDRTTHHSLLGSGRFDFLKLDPAVNNQGRLPLKR